MEPLKDIHGYSYKDAQFNNAHTFLLPTVMKILSDLSHTLSSLRLFELGCGNGAVAHLIASHGWSVVGVDPSIDGIRQGNQNYLNIPLYIGSSDDDLVARYGKFPVVLSLEVVEHVYNPRKYAACVHSLLEEHGVAIISTPYHSYMKNLALALTGKMDAHFTALWEFGHIKFWSMATLTRLLKESGFKSVEYRRIGRIPCLAKSMVAIARK